VAPLTLRSLSLQCFSTGGVSPSPGLTQTLVGGKGIFMLAISIVIVYSYCSPFGAASAACAHAPTITMTPIVFI
jgi:hypothetical protein